MVCADDKAVARISNRIDRLTLGNPGEVKSVGEGVSEMKIDYGPGYRLYFTKRGKVIVLLSAAEPRERKRGTSSGAIKMAKGLG